MDLVDYIVGIIDFVNIKRYFLALLCRLGCKRLRKIKAFRSLLHLFFIKSSPFVSLVLLNSNLYLLKYIILKNKIFKI
ncbi:hypothetical protein EFK83_11990 [Lactococcus cremoris]|nr:hypothetical protein [Lactococcus cremoris]MCT4407619.1 hypothetical protein [Lactococcus cremoris]